VVVDALQPELCIILGVMNDPRISHDGAGHAHAGNHRHTGRPRAAERLRHVLRPHSYEAADAVDVAMEASTADMRALWISLAVLVGTALLQGGGGGALRFGRAVAGGPRDLPAADGCCPSRPSRSGGADLTGPHPWRRWPDSHTASALLKIAAAFNHDYDTGDYGPVYARWDARSQAVITRADYIKRHKDCPSGSQTLSQTESASAGGPHGAWLVYYEIGGQQLTDYCFYVHHRWVFDLMLSNPGAVKLYRTSPSQYAAALGCNH
jgi:hypothetical protein